MTWIKFCGLRRGEDVSAAVELGVDAVGFVFWPRSPRAIDLEDAARLVRTLPAGTTPVGLFVRPTREQIVEAVERAGIRIAQVHGVADVRPLLEVPCELWVATSLNGDLQTIPPALTVLLDAHDPVRHGGTGQSIDWDKAAKITALRRVMLAGGLTAHNVGEAIRRSHPYGVDVSSGIEERPGIKKLGAMRAFVESVRNAEL